MGGFLTTIFSVCNVQKKIIQVAATKRFKLKSKTVHTPYTVHLQFSCTSHLVPQFFQSQWNHTPQTAPVPSLEFLKYEILIPLTYCSLGSTDYMKHTYTFTTIEGTMSVSQIYPTNSEVLNLLSQSLVYLIKIVFKIKIQYNGIAVLSNRMYKSFISFPS